MNSEKRNKIYKSWGGISEVTLIKEVATKGEHVQLCIEYWAKKRKLPIPEYEIFFHDVVQTYVQRLLTERLVCKAENVLCNVQRDVKCFYYQFACESEDAELREQLMDYLQKKDPLGYEKDMQELQFNWELVQQIQACPSLLAKCKLQLRRVNLDTLMHTDTAFHKRLLVELYFNNRNSALLQRMNKFVLWNYLVETENNIELVRWCCSNRHGRGVAGVEIDDAEGNYTELELMYCQWTLESEMFEYALKSLKQPNEVLRNCFASMGYFFADERDDVMMILHRICTTESFTRNQDILEMLPLSGFLLEHDQHFLMLRNFVKAREVEEFADQQPEKKKRDILKLIEALKSNDMQLQYGFQKIANVTKVYLESSGVEFQNEQPLVTLYDFLCNQPTVSSLNCFVLSSALKHIPYLKSLAHRLENQSNTDANTLPTPYDFLRKFKNVDFKVMCKDTQEVASFSNERLCERYARKYNLNFLHYLKQHRSCYAVYYMLVEHLQHYAQITKTNLFSKCESVTALALQHADNKELVTHCVAFIELLGFDTQHLRNFLSLSARFLKNAQRAPPCYSLLIERVECELMEGLAQNSDKFPLLDYQALMRIVACNQYRQWPERIMRHYANEDDWWRLLVLLQYFDVPLSQVRHLADSFGTHAMGEHLLRALFHEPPSESERHPKCQAAGFSRQQKKSQKTESNPATTSIETIASSLSSSIDMNALYKSANQQQLHFLLDSCGNLDLFALILLSTTTIAEDQQSSSMKCALNFLESNTKDTQSNATSVNLMKNSIKHRLSMLALLSTTVSDGPDVDWNWIVWLAVATNQWQQVIHIATKELSQRLIEGSVRQGYTITLHRSFCIFHEENPFVHFFNFLQQTQHQHNFSDEIVHELRLYMLAWSNDEVRLPFCALPMKREEIMQFSARLLLLHLQESFDSTLEQQRFLNCICKSDISDLCDLIDFCLLNEIFAILQHVTDWAQRFPIDFEQLLLHGNNEYERLLDALLEAKLYDLAICLATLLHLPISDIVYAKWVTDLDICTLHESTFELYENQVVEHSLPPELLVTFFLYAASCLDHECILKYMLLKRAMNVIKKHHLFPNESFNRDQIEYEMTLCYLQIGDDIQLESLEIYHSEYFEQIMLKERFVLYKSFLELKELAGIEDLTIRTKSKLAEHMQIRLEALLNQLLDKGDIVEALRLQELFDQRPIDLRFVVFCMALAEGVTTIFSMLPEERQLLSDIEKSSFAKFNRRTLDTPHSSVGSHQGPSTLKANSDFFDSCSTLEFEEIPSKEKRETLDIIQGIASKLKYGVDIGKRIVMAYRAAMYLDKEYLDVLRTKDASVLLQSVSEEGCLRRLLVVSDILTSTHMTAHEIAELLSFEITTAVVRPRFYLFSADQQSSNTFKNADLWGYNIDRDLHLFFELTPNTTKLGYYLLEYCDALRTYRKFQDNKPYVHSTVFERLAEIILRYGLPVAAPASPSSPAQVLSHKKQNLIYVELLIKAHQCFVHECSMEGIANVLNRAKALNAVLTRAKSWSLIVRMLIGISRYREMFYCFDALIENEQFESLLGQFDEEKTIGLRQAILTYLREYSPSNGREYLKLAALHFNMYKDLAEMWEQDAQTLLAKVLAVAQVENVHLGEQISRANLTTGDTAKIIIPKLTTSTEIIQLLHQILENYTHATENYLLDNKLLLAQKSASMAEMIAMQIDLACKAMDKVAAPHLCVCVINVQTREEFRELINAELSVPQSMILSRAYAYDINWSETLLSQYIILQKKQYLNEYLAYVSINDNIINNVVKGFQLYTQHHKPSREMEEHLAQLVELIKSITLKYKLASLLALKPIVISLINEQTSYYLRDTNYGRTENHNVPDM